MENNMNTQVSKEQLYEFSKYVTTHPAFDHIKTLVEQESFQKFVVGNNEQREVISNVMIGMQLWEGQLTQILNNYLEDENINN